MTKGRVRNLILLLWFIPFLFVTIWFVSIPGDGFRHSRCSHKFYNQLPFRLSIFITFIIPLLTTYALYAIIFTTLLKAKAQYNNDKRLNKYQYLKKISGWFVQVHIEND